MLAWSDFDALSYLEIPIIGARVEAIMHLCARLDIQIRIIKVAIDKFADLCLQFEGPVVNLHHLATIISSLLVYHSLQIVEIELQVGCEGEGVGGVRGEG